MSLRVPLTPHGAARIKQPTPETPLGLTNPSPGAPSPGNGATGTPASPTLPSFPHQPWPAQPDGILGGRQLPPPRRADSDARPALTGPGAPPPRSASARPDVAFHAAIPFPLIFNFHFRFLAPFFLLHRTPGTPPRYRGRLRRPHPPLPAHGRSVPPHPPPPPPPPGRGRPPGAANRRFSACPSPARPALPPGPTPDPPSHGASPPEATAREKPAAGRRPPAPGSPQGQPPPPPPAPAERRPAHPLTARPWRRRRPGSPRLS